MTSCAYSGKSERHDQQPKKQKSTWPRLGTELKGLHIYIEKILHSSTISVRLVQACPTYITIYSNTIHTLAVTVYTK